MKYRSEEDCEPNEKKKKVKGKDEVENVSAVEC